GEKCWWTGDGSSKVCSNGSGLVSGIGICVGMDAGGGCVGMDAGGGGVGMDAGGGGVGMDAGGGEYTGGDDVDGTGSVDDDG
ncbi:hypothetical protein Tco_0485760, partial [Tanacetum coccineum]